MYNLPPGAVMPLPLSEVSELLRSSIARFGEVLEHHRADYTSGEGRLRSISWLAAHNLWHLKDSGARAYVNDTLKLNIEKIERTIEREIS